MVESFGPDGTSETAFSRPEELAFDQGNNRLYVLNQVANQIHGYSVPSAGTHTPLGGGFPLTATGAGSRDDIGVDSSSHDLYFASTGESKVFGFDSSGAALGGFPISGVSFACGVAIDSSGDIWVSETFGGNLKKYSPAGVLLGTITIGGEPCDLAIDSQDNIYVAAFNGGTTKYTAASNYTVSSQIDADVEVSNSVAVDRSTDEVYVVHNKYISVYEADGTLLYQFGKAYGAGNGKFTGVAIDQATEQVYVSTKRENKVLVFGPALRLPKVSTEGADSIAATTATVHGTVTPENQALTDCHFDVIPDSQFQAAEFTTVTAAQEFPCVPAAGSISADSNPHAVSADLSGLEAATLYRYRLVAASEVGTANGLSRSFISAAEAPLVKEQLVESVGTGEATLQAKINPKGGETTYHVEYGTTNAYGQSTPESAPVGASIDRTDHLVSVHVGGLSPGTAYHFRFVATNSAGSVQGADVSFATYPEVSAPAGSCPNEQFRTGFGARLPDCRAYEQATPMDKHGADVHSDPRLIEASTSGDRVTFFVNGGLPTSGGASNIYPYVASRSGGGWSSDGILPPTDPGDVAAVFGWDEDLSTVVGSWESGSDTALYLRDGSGNYQRGPSEPGLLFGHLADFAADTSNLLFETDSQLLPEAPAGKNTLYELDHGTLTLPGRIPAGSGSSCDDETGPACVVAPEGSFAGPYNWLSNNLEFGGAQGGFYTRHTISKDGSKVFFTARGTGQLYMREDGTRTVQISASQKTNGSGPGGTDPAGTKPAAWLASTPSGSKVLFSSSEELTNDANTGQDPAIGRANIDGTGVERSFVPTNAGGVTVDGAHIYWTDPAANSIGRANLDGTSVEPSFITGASNPQGIAVDGSFLYWTNAGTGADGTGTIGRANLDGTGIEQSFITGASNPQGIAVDAAHVYWGNAGTTAATRSIARANLDGTEPNQTFVEVAGETGPRGIAVDAGHIYWANPSLKSIDRAPVGGGTAEQGFIHGTSEHSIISLGVAVDAGHIYWAESRGGGEGAIGRASLAAPNEPNLSFIDHTASAQAISVDAAHLYWASSGSRDLGKDLYQYDTTSGELTDLTVDSNPGDVRGAAVVGVLGTSDDGSYVYFAANGVLAPGASAGECGPFGGACTIYVSHNGTITSVARVGGTGGGSERDQYNWAPQTNGTDDVRRASRVSADGRVLLFTSARSLTGYDNSGVTCGEGPNAHQVCAELFRYDASKDALGCISCNPANTRPKGDSVLGEPAGGGRTGFLHGNTSFTFLTRNLSADGDQVFFNSYDRLVPQDVNDASDVYEWEARGSGSCESEAQDGGCIYLLSGGDGQYDSYFGDASTNGDHVFIFSNQRLVPGDEDDLYDVYDVGVGAGLAAQHPLTPATCTSTACQANPAPPPDQTAASAVFSGQGNVHAHSARRCPKGKRKVRKAGKVSCLKAHKQSKRHSKRHSNRGGAK